MPDCFVVTGASGFVGGALKRRLVSHGFEVLNADRSDFSDSQALLDQISSVLQNQPVRGVFHVGAITDTLSTDPNEMLLWNTEFTLSLSNLCQKLGIPLVYSSSAANYGLEGVRPANLYGWSKYLGEKICKANGQVSLRYFNVCGPGESHKGRMASFVFQAIAAEKADLPVKLFPGEPRRDFIFVEDVVTSNLHAMSDYPKISGQVFDVGSGEAVSFEKLMDLAGITYTHSDERSIPAGYQFLTRASKERFLPGWEPEYELSNWVRGYVEWLRSREES